MADERSVSPVSNKGSEGYARGGIAFVGGMAFFLVSLAAKIALLKTAGRKA